jgi:dTDP-4-dehydrorhamnose 3,5-epimerase
MEFIPTALAGAFEVRLQVRGDSRGRFKRHYCERDFAAQGLTTRFVQMNHSVALGIGSLRGMHFQRPPAAEDKLVSCTLGRVFDVAVDLRRDSPTYLKWAAVELDDSRMFYIPKGCAHGFQNLADESHLIYLMSQFYAPKIEGGVRFDDPAVGIVWPLPPATMSVRDLSFPLIDPSFEGLIL